MKRIVVVLAMLALSIGGWAALSGASSQRAVATADVQRLVKVFAKGPSADCGSDYCAIGVSAPIVFGFDSLGDTYDVTISASMSYRTSRGDSALVEVSLRNAAGSSIAVRPHQRSLRPSPDLDTTTLEWSSKNLQSGTTYSLGLHALLPRGLLNARVRTSDVLVEIVGTPG